MTLLAVTSCGRSAPSSSATNVPVAHDPPASPETSVPPTRDRVAVPSGGLCVTEGEVRPVGARMRVESAATRAVVSGSADSVAELRFAYRGGSTTTKALGSGAVRRQVGLKLRAQDPCNLVYVMWRFEPKNEVVVSIKSNPGKSTSRECGNRGYRNVAALKSSAPPAIAVGSEHTIRATLDGSSLEVQIDGASVWKGALDAEATALQGPVGFRSDNVAFDFDFIAGGTASHPSPTCRESPLGVSGEE